jgi:hypothetical protein
MPKPPPSKPLPEIPLDLVLELDRLFPGRPADPTLPEKVNTFEAGKRFVVDWLIQRAEKQSSVKLETTRVFLASPPPSTPGADSTAPAGTLASRRAARSRQGGQSPQHPGG